VVSVKEKMVEMAVLAVTAFVAVAVAFKSPLMNAMSEPEVAAEFGAKV
jgi:hypothetical protein